MEQDLKRSIDNRLLAVGSQFLLIQNRRLAGYCYPMQSYQLSVHLLSQSKRSCQFFSSLGPYQAQSSSYFNRDLLNGISQQTIRGLLALFADDSNNDGDPLVGVSWIDD